MFDLQFTKSILRNFLIWNRQTEFLFEDLYRPVGEVEQIDAARAVIDLIKEGLLEQFVRFTINGTNYDFASISDVPDIIDNIIVTPDDFRIMYRKVLLTTPFQQDV